MEGLPLHNIFVMKGFTVLKNLQKYIGAIFLCATSAGFVAQNLVPNPGMEDTFYCPFANGQMDAVQFWQKPATGGAGSGTSDYYNTCGWNSGLPNTGTGHIGFISYIDFIPNAREYAQVQLDQPLQYSSCYEVSLWVRTDVASAFQMTDLGLLFGDTAIASPGGALIDASPQISTNDLIGEVWTHIIDTITTPVGSAYEWLTIGVFEEDIDVATIYSTGLPGMGVKFMIDDVSVTKIQIDTIGVDIMADTSLCYGQTVELVGASELGTTFRWYDLATGAAISGGLNLAVTITSDTAFVFMAGAACSPYFSDTVRIVLDQISAVTHISREICSGEEMFFGGQYYSSNGVYSDTLSAMYGCDSVVVLTLTVMPEIKSTETVEVCSGDSVLFGSEYVHDPGIYAETLVSVSGCDSIVELIIENCSNAQDEIEYTFFIPNSFTPNEDGLNDVFKPVVSGFESMEFTVFDRWGAKMFESSDANRGWTGIVGNDQAKTDVYAYKFSGRMTNGGAIEKSGHVLLIR